MVDSRNKTPLDLAANEKVKKIILAYADSKGVVQESEEKEKRMEFSKIVGESKLKENHSKVQSKDHESTSKVSSGQVYTK